MPKPTTTRPSGSDARNTKKSGSTGGPITCPGSSTSHANCPVHQHFYSQNDCIDVDVRTTRRDTVTDDDSTEDILSRYIENLPDPGRVTRARHAASRLNPENGDYPVKMLTSTFNEVSSFDQLSTSDYSSSNSTTSTSVKAKRSSGESFSSTNKNKLTPTSDISINEGIFNGGGGVYLNPNNHPSARSTDYIAEPPPIEDLSNCGWESDVEHQQPDGEEEYWGESADIKHFQQLMDKHKGKIISNGDVKLLIPRQNLLGKQLNQFKIEIIQHPAFKPETSLRIHHISKVISLTPRGCIFSEVSPAYLFIPVNIQVDQPANIVCLYAENYPLLETNRVDNSQDEDEVQQVEWLPVPDKSYKYSNGYVIVNTLRLSLLTLLYYEKPPEVRKKIRRRIGGTLNICSHPGIKVTFPRGTCEMDIEATIKVLYDYQPQADPNHAEGGLASPIVMVGPCGYQFDTKKKPVEIELPIPHYKDIKDQWPRANLSVWQSSTREGEELDWKKIEVDKFSTHYYRSTDLHSVSFPTYHFTFFKVVWDILSTKLNSAKMGVSYFYPWMSFPMKCQAYMEENPENKAFGLEVICFNAETNPEQIQTSNYRYCVGSSLKPKLVRPGRILIELKSQKFCADVAAGEEETMIKEEPDFRGRDFEKQFACIFREDIKVDRGTFGKVKVDRLAKEDGSNKENLFEFNLQKSGQETEMCPPDVSDSWSIVAVKELAGHLGLTEDVMKWRNFAKYIGFTKQEIKSKLQNSPDPFLTMMNLYKDRGGTPDEFVQSLYMVGRDLRLDSSNASIQSGTPNSTSSGVTGSGSQRSQDSVNHVSNRFSFFGLRPWRTEEGSDSGTADMHMADMSPADSKNTKKRRLSRDAEMDSPPKSIKRQKLSLAAERRSMTGGSRANGEKEKRKRLNLPSDDSYSSSDESGADVQGGGGGVKSTSTDHHKRNTRKLTDNDLWQISASMNAINWRALGRTLGLEESVLLNLEHAHKGSGMRECAYQTLLTWKETKPKACSFGGLYTALCEEKMNSVAKSMASLLIPHKS